MTKKSAAYWNALYERLRAKKETRDSYQQPLSAEDRKALADFIIYTFDGVKQFDHNKNTRHILYQMVREITRIIGEQGNPAISLKAEKLRGPKAGKLDMAALWSWWKKNKGKTNADHDPPANMFFQQMLERAASSPKASFTQTDAQSWLQDAGLAVITKAEEKLLRDKGWAKIRPADAYQQLGIQTRQVIA